jgi:hypothetical protein
MDSLVTQTILGSLNKRATTLSVPLTSLKHAAITSLAFSTMRSKDWDDILTAHTDETYSRTWSMLNKRLSQHAFGITEKGKTRTVGVIKASLVSLVFSFRAQLCDRLFASRLVAISGLRVLPRAPFICGTCNPVPIVSFSTLGLVQKAFKQTIDLLLENKGAKSAVLRASPRIH